MDDEWVNTGYAHQKLKPHMESIVALDDPQKLGKKSWPPPHTRTHTDHYRDCTHSAQAVHEGSVRNNLHAHTNGSALMQVTPNGHNLNLARLSDKTANHFDYCSGLHWRSCYIGPLYVLYMLRGRRTSNRGQLRITVLSKTIGKPAGQMLYEAG